MRFGSKCLGVLSFQSNWLGMNQVAFQLGEPFFWHLPQQRQIEALLGNLELPATDAEFSETGRIQQIFEDTITRRSSEIHLELEKINFE
tara:strand:- start:24 stop:290 length:267 start_codon:yes stop_codon:yes gene_type:complete